MVEETAAPEGAAAAAPYDELRIDLREPVVGLPDLKSVALRHPTAREILAHGYPYSYQATPDDDVVAIDHHEAIAYYSEACIVAENRGSILNGLSMVDTMELRERVVGFFLAAQRKRLPSAASSTSSSSI